MMHMPEQPALPRPLLLAALGLAVALGPVLPSRPPSAGAAAQQVSPRMWTRVEVRPAGYDPATLLDPRGVARGPGGRFYVADAGHHRVAVIDASGAVVQAFGEPGDGPLGLDSPVDVAVDGSRDRVYVADYGNRRVSVFTLAGAPVARWRRAGLEQARTSRPDIILLDMHKPHLTPLYNCYSQLVYAASGSDTKTSIIGGKIVMRDRHLITIDVERAMKNVRTIAAGIKNGNSFAFTHPQGTPASDLTASCRWSTDLATFHLGGATSGGTTVNLTTEADTPSPGFTRVTATATRPGESTPGRPPRARVELHRGRRGTDLGGLRGGPGPRGPLQGRCPPPR